MRLRITLVAATITAIVAGIAGWLLIRSVEDTQLAGIRDRAQESLDIAADRLESGDSWEAALTGLPAVVFVSDESGECVVSNPVEDQLVFRCSDTSGQLSLGAVQMSPGIGTTIADPNELARTDVMGGEGLSGEAVAGSEMAGEGLSGEAVAPPGVVLARGLTATERLTATVETDRYGPLVVTAAAPADTVVRGIESVGTIVWFLFPALVALAAGLAWWLAGRTLRPVEAIRREADEIGATSLHRRVPQPGANDEIGRLARTMNAMFDRLERGAQRQRRFVSDASHELRSPVAAIRTDLEVALAEADPDWPTTARAVLSEQARLDGLIGDLLILAVGDEGERGIDDATVELEPVVTDAAARRRRIPTRVTIQADGSCSVRGSASGLARAMGNLLDNAARHAEARVEITLTGDDSQVIVHVDDDGPGIDPADRERIFERFARLDEGRARDRGGAGLGLAVARTIVERHGGSLVADDSPAGGARFTASLPRA